MAFEWPSVRLEALVRSERPITYGVVKPGIEDPEGVIFVRGGDISNGRVAVDRLRTITKTVSDQYKRTLLSGGELLVSLVGNPGEVAIAPVALKGANIARQVGLICLRDDVDARYVQYFLASPLGRRALGAQSLGSVQIVINLRDLKNVELPIPPLSVQRDISSVLGVVDDRIDNLRQTNATLEAIAQALFKSWFVDCDPVRAKAEGRDPEGMDTATAALFPSEFEDSELGPIPKSWRRVRFGDVATQTKGSVNPLASPERVFQHYSLPAFDTGQLPVAEAGEAIKSNKTPVPSGAVLVSKLNPHIPRIWFVGEVEGNSVCSTEFLVWTPKSGIGSAFLYCLASSTAFNSAMRQLVTGTSNSHQRVKPDQLANVQAAVVSEAAVLAFEAIAAPLLQQVERNRHRGATLAALRDTLLPRLISGKLRLPDVVEEVVAV